MTKLDEAMIELERFTRIHNLKIIRDGEVGFGRECVGLIPNESNSYLEYNPLSMKTFDYVFDYDDRLSSPSGVDAYHKHNCFSVLVGDEGIEHALLGLCKWIDKICDIGQVSIIEYETGSVGLQALMTGDTGYAMILK